MRLLLALPFVWAIGHYFLGPFTAMLFGICVGVAIAAYEKRMGL